MKYRRLLLPKPLYENEDFIAFDKPAGLPCVPDRHQGASLFSCYTQQHPGALVVHRLDKLTSGVNIFAKHPQAHRQLSALFEHRKIDKHYLAIVRNSFIGDPKVVRAPLAVRKGSALVEITPRGKTSETHFFCKQNFLHYALLHCVPKTGRTHQIRVHAASIGHPIVGDPLYGDNHAIYLSQCKGKHKYKCAPNTKENPILSRLALHAHVLRFMWKGEMCNLEAPMPQAFCVALKLLHKYDSLVPFPTFFPS